jgi:MFS family permease
MEVNMNNEMLSKKTSMRNIYLSVTGLFTSMLGTRIYYFMIGFMILKSTGSSLEFAISILVGALPAVLLSPIAGSVADRYDKKKLLIVFDSLSGFFMFLCFLLYPLVSSQILFLYFSIFILSVLNTFFNMSMESSTPFITTKELLIKINSYRTVVNSSAAILAPIIGGVLYTLIDIQVFMLMNGFSFIFSAFTEAFIQFKKQENRKSIEVSILGNIKEGMSFVSKREDIKTLVKIFAIVNFLLSGFTILFSVIFITDLGFDSVSYGSVQSFIFIGMLLSALFLSQLKKKLALKSTVLMLLPILATCFLLIAMPIHAIVGTYNKLFYMIYFSLIVFCIGASVAGLDIPARSYLQATVDEDYMGRVAGFISSLTQFAMPFGTVIFGIALDYIKSPYVALAISSLLFVYSIYLYYNMTIQEVGTNIQVGEA